MDKNDPMDTDVPREVYTNDSTDISTIQNYIHSLYIYYTTTSYTVISLLYLGLGLVYFFLFFFMSLAIRAELNCLGFYSTGNGAFEIYNAIITSHGLGMIFLFIMPTVISFVGN